jgi:drug/metabolite transporter (DMT)-like permease
MDAKRLGVLAVLVASVIWAIEPILAKLSYQNSDFLHTLAMRAIFVTLTAFVYGMLTTKEHFRINKKQLSALVYLAIVANVFGDIMYFFALTQVPVVNAVLIGYMQPIFVVLIGFLVLKEDKLTRYDYIGVLVMIASGLLITTRTVENLLTLRLGTYGDLFVLSATIAWATTTLVLRKYLRDTNAGVVCFYRFLFAFISFATYLVSTSTLSIANIYQVLIGIVVGIGTILYIEGVKRLKAAQASALELSTPFFAAVLGFLILGELVTMMQSIGILVLFAGVYFLSKKEKV